MKYIVVANGAWHLYHWIYDLEEAKAEARAYAEAGDDAQVYKLVETHYYKAKPGRE